MFVALAACRGLFIAPQASLENLAIFEVLESEVVARHFGHHPQGNKAHDLAPHDGNPVALRFHPHKLKRSMERGLERIDDVHGDLDDPTLLERYPDRLHI